MLCPGEAQAISEISSKNHWTYNHIKHLLDSNEGLVNAGNITIEVHLKPYSAKYKPAQLDGKQCHARFNQYEDDRPKLPSTTSQGGLDLQVHLHDSEHY